MKTKTTPIVALVGASLCLFPGGLTAGGGADAPLYAGIPVTIGSPQTGTLIASNDNWKDTQQAVIQATGLAPPDDRESAILTTFALGNFTAIVRGKNNTTGVGLVEVYNIP